MVVSDNDIGIPSENSIAESARYLGIMQFSSIDTRKRTGIQFLIKNSRTYAFRAPHSRRMSTLQAKDGRSLNADTIQKRVQLQQMQRGQGYTDLVGRAIVRGTGALLSLRLMIVYASYVSSTATQ